MGFMGQKKFGDDRKYFWFQVRDCRAVTAHFVHNNAPCNDRLCKWDFLTEHFAGW